MDKTSEIIIDKIPTYQINNLPEIYHEALLKNTEISMKENEKYQHNQKCWRSFRGANVALEPPNCCLLSGNI